MGDKPKYPPPVEPTPMEKRLRQYFEQMSGQLYTFVSPGMMSDRAIGDFGLPREQKMQAIELRIPETQGPKAFSQLFLAQLNEKLGYDRTQQLLELIAQERKIGFQETEVLKTTIKQWVDTFDKLKATPLLQASVIAVKGKSVTIQSGGRLIDVKLPTGLILKIGQSVLVAADTMQIVEAVPPTEETVAGELLDVIRIADSKTCEVERQGACRAVTYSGALEEGDRVVLDQSATVVIANLGKPPDMNRMDEATGVTWDDIGGLDHAKRELREALEAPVKHGEMMKRLGKRAARGALLYGGPGCGKTLLGKAAATAMAELHGGKTGGFFYVKGPALLDKFVGQTEASIRRLFQQARQYKKRVGHPAIIFIDEAEAILGPRSSGLMTDRGFMSSTVVPQFLSEMDGMEDSGAFVLLATNRPTSIDSAIVRDGRIDRRIKVGRPERADAGEILMKHIRTAPLALPSDEAIRIVLDDLYDPSRVLYKIKRTSSVGAGTNMSLSALVSGAMLAGIVDRATSSAMRRSLAGGELEVQEQDLRDAVRSVYLESRDVNHDQEILEFTEGWMHDVVAITRADTGKTHVPSHMS